MKITFFERKFNPDVISIEKLFDTLRIEFSQLGCTFEIIKNPYDLKNMLKSLIFFKKNQGRINHIVGDIHWASLLLDRDRFVLTIHDLVGLNDLRGIKKFLYFILWVYLPLRIARYVTVISDKVKSDIVKLIPSAESKIIVIPNCVTIAIQDPVVRKQVKKVLIIGTRSNKNIERAIQALTGLDVELVIVGRLSELQQKLLENGKISFSNHINISDSKLETLYDESDLLLFVSLYEGFGLPILEAQARSCVVITSNISPMSDVANDGALLVDPYSIEDIRQAILNVMNDSSLRSKLIINGFRNVEKYSPNNIAKKYLELYNKINKKYE